MPPLNLAIYTFQQSRLPVRQLMTFLRGEFAEQGRDLGGNPPSGINSAGDPNSRHAATEFSALRAACS
jgi:hypothetical protein